MVTRHKDSINETIGHEYLTAEDIVETVDGRKGGTVVFVYGIKPLSDITPALLDYKDEARRWYAKFKEKEL